MSGAVPPLPQYAFVAWCSVKAQGQLYLCLLPERKAGLVGPGHVWEDDIDQLRTMHDISQIRYPSLSGFICCFREKRDIAVSQQLGFSATQFMGYTEYESG
jgi:hypothetical protein